MSSSSELGAVPVDDRVVKMKLEQKDTNVFPYCDDSSKYKIVTKIGQGTFGEVFKARSTTDDRFVAMKRVLVVNEKEGFPITTLREIKILQQLKHENVVNLIEICRVKADDSRKCRFFLIFEFCEHDLAGLLSNLNVKFKLAEIKKVIQQLLNGLYYLHMNQIFHRDLKPANILLTKTGILKLADFGSARSISKYNNNYSNCVVTLWYRPPELLLGAQNYSLAVDMWSVGCIMAEMWNRSPILPGSTEQHQLALCAQLCGSFTTQNWPGIDKLELFNKINLPKGLKRRVRDRFGLQVRDLQALALIDQLLILDPAKRINVDDALNHAFFWTDPMPSDLTKLFSQLTQCNFNFLTTPKKRVNDGSYQDRTY